MLGGGVDLLPPLPHFRGDLMKKIFTILPLLILLAMTPNLAFAKTFDLSTSATLTSGNTTVVNGGVSTFVVNGVAASYDLYPQLNRYYAFGFALSHVTPSQVALDAGNWSGVTFSVYGKFKSEDSTVPWDAVEPVYFIKDEAADSATSPYPRWISVPPADLARIYFVSEGGNTAYGLATGKLIASEIPLEITDAPIVISEGTFTMPASGTGVSQFTAASIGTFPNGVNLGNLQLLSGASCFFTTDGSTPTASSFVLTNKSVLKLKEDEARKLKLITGVEATTVRFQLLGGKP